MVPPYRGACRWSGVLCGGGARLLDSASDTAASPGLAGVSEQEAMTAHPGEITVLLGALAAGGAEAADALLPRVYDALRQIARKKMQGERAGHTLQPTALAHEAFVNLLGQDRVQWRSRAHSLAVAALAMRRILINHAKARLAEKRGADSPVVTFEDGVGSRELRAAELVALDDALTDLAKHNERHSKVVAYKFFGGLGYEDIAEVLGISVPTVRRDWRFARAWLLRALSDDPQGGARPR